MDRDPKYKSEIEHIIDRLSIVLEGYNEIIGYNLWFENTLIGDDILKLCVELVIYDGLDERTLQLHTNIDFGRSDNLEILVQAINNSIERQIPFVLRVIENNSYATALESLNVGLRPDILQYVVYTDWLSGKNPEIRQVNMSLSNGLLEIASSAEQTLRMLFGDKFSDFFSLGLIEDRHSFEVLLEIKLMVNGELISFQMKKIYKIDDSYYQNNNWSDMGVELGNKLFEIINSQLD